MPDDTGAAAFSGAVGLWGKGRVMDELEGWNDRWSVGIDGIDEEHRYFIHLLDQFNDDGSGGLSGQRLRDMAAELLTYTEEHFTNEEKVMEAAGYPLYDDHRYQHDLAEDEIRHTMNTPMPEAEFRAFLGRFMLNWLVLHIQSSDQKLSAWLRENGVEYQRLFDGIISRRDWMRLRRDTDSLLTPAAE